MRKSRARTLRSGPQVTVLPGARASRPPHGWRIGPGSPGALSAGHGPLGSLSLQQADHHGQAVGQGEKGCRDGGYPQTERDRRGRPRDEDQAAEGGDQAAVRRSGLGSRVPGRTVLRCLQRLHTSWSRPPPWAKRLCRPGPWPGSPRPGGGQKHVLVSESRAPGKPVPRAPPQGAKGRLRSALDQYLGGGNATAANSGGKGGFTSFLHPSG